MFEHLDLLAIVTDGEEASQVAVLSRTKATLGPVEQRLLAKGIQVVRIGQRRDTTHARYVLRLVRLVESFAEGKLRIDIAALRKVLGKVAVLEGQVDRWKLLVTSLRKAARAPSLEGRFQICADVYMRSLGGTKKNTEIQHDLNRWAPLCQGVEDASLMSKTIQSLEPPGLVTATIHAAKGKEWDHVLVVGVADGQLPLYLATTEEKLAEERRLLFVATTRPRQTLTLFHAPVDHARSRRRFDQLSRFLEPASVKGLMSAVKC